MRSSAKFFLFGLILAAMVAALPGQADAAVTRDAFRNDSFAVGIQQAGRPDSSLVPGGVVRYYLNTLGAFGVEGQAFGDSFVQMNLLFTKPATTVLPFSNIVETVQLYIDGDNNGVLNGNGVENTLVASISSPGSSGPDTALYTVGPFVRTLGTGAESYVIVVQTRNNQALADSTFFAKLSALGGVIIQIDNTTQSLRPISEITFPTFQFKVYNDSTTSHFLANTFRHQDSAAGGQPFSILHGSVQAETRTVGGDSLAKFGVNFGGTAGAFVDSAWLLVGRAGVADRRVDLAQVAGVPHSWNAPAITTIPLGLGGLDTFRVVATVSYPPLHSTLACTIPADSIQTRFRHANLAATDSSGVVTFTRPRVAVSDSALTNLVVFPDSQVAGQMPFLAAAGTIDADTLLTPQLANDTVNRFTVGLLFGTTGGLAPRHTDVESVAIEVDGDTVTGTWIPGTDSWTAQFGTAVSGFGLSTNFRVWINLRETAPVNGTFRVHVPIDSVHTRFRDTGPSASLLASRTITVNRPRIATVDSALPSIGVHPDTQVTDSFILATYSIQPDTLLSTPLTLDTITRLATRLIFGGGLNATHIDTVRFLVNGRFHVPSSVGTDTYGLGYASNYVETFTTGCSVSIYVKTNNNAPINGTVQAQLLVDTITARWRLAGPSAELLGSRTVTMHKPRVSIADSRLADIGVHPDTRINGGNIQMLQGVLLADTFTPVPVRADSVTMFVVRAIGAGNLDTTHIAAGGVKIVLNEETFTARAGGVDTFYISLANTDSKPFTDSVAYRVYVQTLPHAPLNGTLRFQLGIDSIQTHFRVAGAHSSVDTARTITINRPMLEVADSFLGNVAVHPDSRVAGSDIPMMLGRIATDTLLTPTLANDTVIRMEFRLIFGGGMDSRSLAAGGVKVVLQGETFTATAGNGPHTNIDTWIIQPNKYIGDSAAYSINVTFLPTAPISGTVRAQLLRDSIATVFRDSGSHQISIDTARTVTIQRPSLEVADSSLGNITLHPDTRVSGSDIPALFGRIAPDTMLSPTLSGDTIVRMEFRLIFGGGMDSRSLAAGGVKVVLQGETFTATAANGPIANQDTWFIAPNKFFADSASYVINLTFLATAPVNGTVQAQLLRDSIATTFRDSGSHQVSIDTARVITIQKPRVAVLDSAMPSVFIHPDSRVLNDSVLLAQGSIIADTLTSLHAVTNDTITGFAVSVASSAGITATSFETIVIVLNGTSYATPSLVVPFQLHLLPNQAVTGTTTYQVYGRPHNTVAAGETIQVRIHADSITTTFRVAGPSDTVSARTETTVKPRIGLTDSALGNILIHPDSRVAGFHPVVAAYGFINADTLTLNPAIGADSLVSFGVGLQLTGGITAAMIESVGISIAGETFTATRDGALDTWRIAPTSKNFTGTTAYSVILSVHAAAPANGTIRAVIAVDSVTSRFRVAGPSSALTAARTITINKPRVAIVDSTLPSINILPDSRILRDSVLLAQGTILGDTIFSSGIHGGTLTYDTLSSFGFTIATSAGITNTSFETISVVINGVSHDTASVITGTQYHFLPNQTVPGTFVYQIYARPKNTVGANETIHVQIHRDSVVTLFRVAGSSDTVLGSRTCTTVRPRLAILDSALPAITVHPDTRVTDSFLLMAGWVTADTLLNNTLTHDTISSFAVRLLFSSGINGNSVAAGGVRIHLGTSIYTATRGATDTWFVSPNHTFTDSVAYAVYARMLPTAKTQETVSAQILRESIAAQFRLAGPSAEVDSFRRVTLAKQQVIVTMNTLANGFGHPDSRAQTAARQFTVDTFLVASGAVHADSFTGIVGDTLVNFGFRLALTGIHQVDFESVAVVINGDTRTATNSVANLDSWFVTANKVVSDTFNFRIYVTPKESAAVGSTIRAFVAVDSITTTFRDSGVRSETTSTGIFTCTKPIVGNHARFLAVPGNDTINPIVAFGTPVIVYDGIFRIDSGLIKVDYDTFRQLEVRFSGSARDSVYNAAFQFKIGGPWVAMSKVGADTWLTTGLDSTVRSGDSLAIRINLADSTTTGTDLAAWFSIQGCTTVWSVAGPGQVNDSSGLFLVAADPITLVMWNLGDTVIPPWAQLRSTDTLLICSGVMFTNVGPVAMPVYDTLTHFGFVFDTVGATLAADSIAGCSLVLMPSAAKPHGAVISLDTDAANRRLWRFRTGTSDTTIAETQPFQIWIRIVGNRSNVGEQLFGRIPRDSVNTTFTAGLAGETHSSRIVHFAFPDSVQLVQSTFYTDTNVNPDSRSGDNPFIIFAGTIRGETGAKTVGVSGDSGQQWFGTAGDSLIYFGIRILSPVLGVNTADSVEAVTVYLGATARPIVLSRAGSTPDGFGANIYHWNTAGSNLDSRLMGSGNSETFVVRVRIGETVALGNNFRLAADIFSDSVRTYFMGDSSPIYTLVGHRKVTFLKPSFALAMTPLGDTIVSPFRQQNESTVALVGRFEQAQNPTDSLWAFQLRLTGSTNFRGESVSVTLVLESGLIYPHYETTLVRIDNNVSNPRFSFQGLHPVETGQAFTVRVRVFDTNVYTLIGETVSLTVDSAAALYSLGTQTNAGCSRTIHFNYVDTVLITDAGLSDTTIHTDSRALINPVIAFRGAIRGQASRIGLADTIQRFGVRFAGTAVGGGDSIQSAWVVLQTGATGPDTLALVRRDTDKWGIALDSQVLQGQVMECTLYIRVFETTALGTTLRAVFEADSIATYFTADTARYQALRTITLQKPALSLTVANLGDTTVNPFRALNDSTVVLEGRFASTYTSIDTLTRFGVRLAATAAVRGESLQVWLQLTGGPATTDTNFPLSLSIASSNVAEFNLPANTPVLVDTNTAFRVRVIANDTPISFIGQSVSFSIPADSITTAMTAAPAGSLTCSRTVRYAYTDTVLITDSALVDTTIHPDSRSLTNPFLAMVVNIKGQQSIVNVGDTVTAIAFRIIGTSVGSTDSTVAAWIVLNGNDTRNLSRLGAETWGLANHLDSPLAYNGTLGCSVYVRVAETVALGTTLKVTVPAGGIRTYYTAATQSAVAAARTVTYGKPTFGIAVDFLPDTIVSPFRVQNDSTVLFSGRFSQTYVVTDSLVTFGLRLSGSSRIRGESFIVRMHFSAGSVTPASETTLQLVNAASNTPTFRLSAPISIDTNQRFEVRVIANDTISAFLGESVTATMPSDSAYAAWVVGTQGNLSCSRIINFGYTDTIILTDSTLPDTTTHPDSRTLLNPFVAMNFLIGGQTSARHPSISTEVSDTIRFVTVRYEGTAVAGGDSVQHCTLVVSSVGSGVNTAFTMARLDTDRWRVLLDSPIRYNQTLACTIYTQIFETSALQTTIRAVLDRGAIRTTLTAGKDTVLFGRTVTIGKPSFGITVDFLNDSIVSIWRAQWDSTPVMTGYVNSAYFPTDSLVEFRIQMVNPSGNLRAESMYVTFRRESGVYTPSMDTDMVKVDTYTWRIQQPFNIDTGQRFSVWVTATETPTLMQKGRFGNGSLIGESTSFKIPKDSAYASLTVGAQGNLSCSRIVSWAYVDTLLVSESGLASITVHPDSRMLQNPFILFRGSMRGQRTKAGLDDTISRVVFRFNGTAINRIPGNNHAAALDSIVSAWLVVDTGSGIGPETKALVRTDSDAWGITSTFRLPYASGTAMQCTLYVRVSDSTTLGSTMWAELLPDSVSAFYSADTPIYDTNLVHRFSRTVTFGKPAATAINDTYASIGWVHPVNEMRNYPYYLRARGQESNPTLIMSGNLGGDSSALPILATLGDTLRHFAINFSGQAKGFITACTMYIGPNRSVVVLSQETNVAGVYDTWSTYRYFNGGVSMRIDSPFVLPDIAADTYRIEVHIQETVPQGAQLFSWIPVGGIITQYRDTGPLAPITSECTFTYRRDSMVIWTEPRHPSQNSRLEVGETRQIMWFVPRSDVLSDTLMSLKVLLVGSANRAASFDTVLLYRDVNRNKIWDSTIIWPSSAVTPGDSLIGYFTQDAGTGETWTLNVYTGQAYGPRDSAFQADTYNQMLEMGPLSPFKGTQLDTAEYLIVVRLRDTAMASLQAVIPALGAKGQWTESGTSIAVGSDSYYAVPPDTTQPLQPANFNVTVNAGALVITFEPSASGDTEMLGGSYILYWDTGAGVFPVVVLKTLAHVSGQLSYTLSLPDSTASLNPDSTYRFSLVAQDAAGNRSGLTPVVTATFRSALTQPAQASVGIVSPQAGDFVYYNKGLANNRITVVAKLADRFSASLVTGVEFGIRRVTDPGFGFTPFALATDSSYDAAGEVYFSGILDSSVLLRDSAFVDSYEVRAVAITAAGRDTYASSVSFVLVTDTIFATYVTIPGDSRAAADSTFLEQVVTTRTGEDIVAMRTPTGAFDVVLRLNRGSIASDTARIVGLLRRNEIPDTFANALKAVGVEVLAYWAQFTLQQNSGDTRLYGNLGTLTINYIDANDDGIDDSSFVDFTKCKIYTINGTGQAELLEGVTLDRARRTLTGTVKHFSPFFVTNDTGTNAAGLNRLIVGPNPYRPNDGNAQTGRPWVPGDATTGIMFKNLPNRVRIEIFTILGERVTEINKNDANATISWGARNQDNRDVASGYYLYVVTDLATGQRVTGKIAVIR